MSTTGVFDSLPLVVGALVLSVGIVVLVVIGLRRRRVRLRRLAEAKLLPRLAPALDRRPAGRAATLALVGLFGGLAFAGPRWGEELVSVRGEGVDVVLALDASLSMLATDERPNRLERMKQEVRRYRDLSRGDRVALLAFAGRSYILTPLTVDDGAIELFLDNLDPSVVGQAGSSIARTIAQGTDLLMATRTASDRALVLMSDGEAFESPDEISAAAQKARESGVYLVTVGFGTPEGSTLPVLVNGKTENKRDENDQVVVSRYNPETLRLVAETGEGTFIDASATDKAARIRAALQRLKSAPRAMASGTSRTPRFQWFLWPALALLAAETWWQVRRRRRARGIAAASALLAASCTWSGALPRDAAREFHAGRYPRSAALYRSAIAKGDARPELTYNLGTVLVAGDSLAPGIEALEASRKHENPELRFRALFNAGLGHLKQGLEAEMRQDSTARDAFAAAVQSYKEALLLRSSDRDAKWNYELALRKERESAGGGGGGGGAGGNSDARDRNQSDFDTPQSRQQSGGLGQQQAEQLLNAAAREERGVQGRRQKDARPKPPTGGKDW